MCAQSLDIIFINYRNWPAKPLIRHQTNIKVKATLSISFFTTSASDDDEL